MEQDQCNSNFDLIKFFIQMASENINENTPGVPRESGDENIVNSNGPNLASNGVRTNANGLKVDTNCNMDCKVQLNDSLGNENLNKYMVMCASCSRSFKGIKGLKIHLARSACKHKSNGIVEDNEGARLNNETGETVNNFHPLCLTCPDLNKSEQFSSSITGRTHRVVGVTSSSVNCKIQNYIYLLTCNGCGMQYVGESIISLHKRMNIHRKNKSGCERMIEHFTEICKDATFSIQILEKLEGNGYKKGARDKDMYKKRLEREDYWIKTIRTVYPYGLNDKVKQGKDEVPVGKLFNPLPRHGLRQPVQTRARTGGNPNDSIDSFFLKFFRKIKVNVGIFAVNA